ncbi:hypothetical protein CXY01_03950 [Cellulomonas xylanilytica]|uniref:Competence protein CoiA nuclease-like domain-containing protein n=1 Tax=Cellulomonas xylanilytica TaxID=233583 RepID=A0A510V429_9CELL|nr:hypothetical protein CXY01_03950 [Cellulomonas xylanilytica]
MASFTNGETRLVYARYRNALPSAPLYYLEDDTVTNEVRAFARQQLICVVPGCPSEGLTAAHRHNKRDGFVHRGTNVTAGHAAESVNHLQGKAAVMAWLARVHPELDARTEVSLAGRERVADVLVTFRDGQRVAIEVQYAAMKVGEWEERHHSYARMGIVDVWLFGHTGHQMNVRDGAVYPNDVQRKVMETGAPLLWVNPDLDMIATATELEAAIRPPMLGVGYAVRFTDSHGQRPFTVPAWRGPADLAIDSFNAARLTPQGVSSPLLQALAQARIDLDALNAARERVVAEVQARQEADRLKDAQRRAADALRANYENAVQNGERQKTTDAAIASQQGLRDSLTAQQEAIDARDARERVALEASAATRLSFAHDQIAAAFGEVPEFLRVHLEPHSLAMCTYWQWETYRRVIHQAVGASFTVYDAYGHAKTVIGSGKPTGNAVRTWLQALTRMGMLATSDNTRFAVVRPVPATVEVPTGRSAAPEVQRCTECRQPLDPPFTREGSGRHSGCGPSLFARDELVPLPRASAPTSARLGKVKTCKACANPLTGTETDGFHDGCQPWRAKAARWGQQ